MPCDFFFSVENLRRVLAQKEQVLSQLSKIELDRVDRHVYTCSIDYNTVILHGAALEKVPL